MWRALAVLPNFEVRGTTAIEAGHVAFASQDDQRVHELIDHSIVHRIFLNRFKSAFGDRKSPTILLANPQAKGDYQTVEAMASIRDTLSGSVVPLARALWVTGGQLSAPLCFSRVFDFYPWKVDQEAKGLVMLTPSVGALDDIDNFQGQVSPEVSTAELSPHDIDRPVFLELTRIWCKAYDGTALEGKDLALMRSLNMMHHACQLPAYQDTRSFDYGRLTALWVSAFEILAHPGPGRSVKERHIMELISKADWSDRRFADLSKELYKQLYDARGAFLHGSEIEEKHLITVAGRIPLHQLAAPIYRMALASFLKLKLEMPDIGHPDREVLQQQHNKYWNGRRPRDRMEEAIALADESHP